MTPTGPLDEQALMKKALLEIRELRARLERAEGARGEPVAVIGMSCRFPGADDPAAFWDLLRRGGDAIGEVPKDRWDVDAYYDPDPAKPGKMYTRWGGFLKDVEGFSPAFFGISPREAASMDPQQRLLLEVSWEALESAAVAPERLSGGRVGVFVGAGATDYSERMVMQGPAAIDPYNGTGTAFSVTSGRLSYLLGAQGPSLALDTACSSSLAAVHLATASLRNRESDLALAGGVNMILSPDSLVSLCKARMLSPDGRCKTFDASANGYVRAEGCGVLVLKRLKDALAASDNILAVIRGSACNHNGRSSGLTVPSGPAQQALIREALTNAGLKPRDVSYVEAHGTGTAVGDPIEVGALASVFAGRSRPVLVGSVKSNVGHLEWAAGVCGLIKVILSMRHDHIPANLHLKNPNPHLDWGNLPLRVVTELTPWPEGRRVAGVSSFGFGGSNAHVVLEAPPAPVATGTNLDRPLHVCALSARTPEALRALAGRYADWLDRIDPSRIGDVCHTANTGRAAFERRLAAVVDSTGTLRDRLREAAAGGTPTGALTGHASVGRPRVAMLFTGQGSQYAGMGRELYVTQPTFRRTLERCDEILRDTLRAPLLEILYPPQGASDAARRRIDQTAYTQPALFALEYALAELWRAWGVRPQVVIGHSVGEYVAACVAGVFGLEDGLRLIAERAGLMQALPAGGAMVAVRAPEEQVRRAMGGHEKSVAIAALNGPHDVVISGERRAVEAVCARLRAEGAAAQALTVSHAFHSPLMEPMLADFERVARSVHFREPDIELISNATGRLAAAELTDPTYWARHVRNPVRFAAGMATLAAQGCDVYLEVGPQPTLIGLGRQAGSEAGAAWLPSLRPKRGDWQQMLESLAALFVRGVAVDWAGFDQGHARRKVELPTYPFERQRYPLPKPARTHGNGSAARYPLAETVLQTPLVRETVFATPISAELYPYLADHRVIGEVVAPAACYLAMMLNGAGRVGYSGCRLEEVFIVAPLVLAAHEERTMQAVLDPEGGFKIISLAPGKSSGEMVTHVSGRLAEIAHVEPSAVSLDEAQARCVSPVDVEALLARLEGIEFGTSFRWIGALWSGPRETLARLILPASVGRTDDYWLHPGLLDACFQTAGGTLHGDEDSDVLLPFRVQALEIVSRATGTDWWCHARQAGELTWDFHLFDSSGATVARVRGFEMRKLSAEALQGRKTTDWIYRVEWQPKPRRVPEAPAQAGSWLIVDRGSGLGTEVAAQLKRQGRRAESVVDDGEVRRMLAEANGEPWGNVTYLCGRHGGEETPAAAEAASVGLLHLAQALNQAGTPPRLWVVTQGCQAVLPSDPIILTPAPLWGLARALQLEAPALKCTCVDIPPCPDASDFAALLSELTVPSDETQVALRPGERFVPRLARPRDSRLPEVAAPFRLQLAEYGSPDQLRLIPQTRRAPGPGEVEIEVKAAVLNFRDVLISLGMLKEYYARVMKINRAQDVPLGFDCAGVVAAVGAGVTDFRAGDEVMTSFMGSFANFHIAPRTDVVPRPAGLSFEQAAAIPTVFLTAHYSLRHLAGLKAGERVLIHSAAGGVGQAAVQVAQAIGAEVYATASPGKRDYLKAQGVKYVLSSRTLDFAEDVLRTTGGEGVDVVLNSLSGEAIGKSFDALKKGGRFVEIGLLGTWSTEEVAARRPDVTYHTLELYQTVDRDPTLPHRVLGEVRAWFEAGLLRPLPQRVFPVRDAIEAYRFLQQARHVGKVALSFAPESEPAVRAEGSYLITGGLGALGLRVAGHLVEQGARHLVLTGRSAATPQARETVERLRAAGASVAEVRADVARAEDVSRLIEACQAQAPLRGVIHAAGVLDDGIHDRQTAERFARVMAPKVHGAWHLHTLTQEIPLDFFVLFSSMASVLGSAGQTNYAAANAFLDALAHHRRARGLPALTINWGPWAEAGMAARLSLAGQGVEKMEVADGLRVLGDLLRPARRHGAAQVGVWRVNWPAFQRRLPSGEVPPFLGAFARQAPPARHAAAAGELMERFRAAADSERADLVESRVQKELLEVLGRQSTEQILVTQPWADLGLDSLMTVDLKNRLEALTGLTLPVERLARDVSTRALAAFIVQKLEDAGSAAGAAPEKNAAEPTDDDLQQLATQIPQLFTVADRQDGRRVLCGGRWRLDFASCNYLGLDLHPEVMAAIPPAVAEWGVHPSWTRAVASPRLYNDLERELAAFVGAPAALVFPSISLLHTGVLPLLAGDDGVILKDAEAHHSIHEGCLRAQASGAEWVAFPHGDIDDLARKLARYRPGRTKVIATDGVYSMGSSHPPLVEYVRLAKEHGALVYVDDAHGIGIIGERPDEALPYGYRGNGMVRHFGLDYRADRIVYVAGLSKAFSSYAAFVTCFDEKMKWTLQGSGPFVFSGPTCVASLASALAGLRVNAREGDEKRKQVYRLTRRLVTAARALGFEVDNGEHFPIVGVVIGSLEDLVRACRLLWEHDVLITPAFYPAVPLHRNLVRFSITAANTEEEVDRAVGALKAVRDALGTGNGTSR
jgi:acyl transferase domain-containing protein/7-keto-8-aminopelargonate synthetase-like enzyme/acyl carrier protein